MKKSFKIKWINAVDEDFFISTDVLILIVEWLFKTGKKYQMQDYFPGRYYRTTKGVYELLFGSNCVNTQFYNSYNIPVFDKEMLRKIIMRAVLKTNVLPICQKWREDFNIIYGKSRMITAINDIDTQYYGMYDGCKTFEDSLQNLKSFEGKKLNYSPNKFHPNDNYIRSIKFKPYGPGLYCQLEYGDKERCSSWIAKEYKHEGQYIPDWIKSILSNVQQITV